MTWKPEPKMTTKQIEKELNRQAVMFEEACNKGYQSKAIKFEVFAEQWFEEYAKTMFGGKVTVAKDDWENITALAKREVTSTKQVRKLKKERDEAVQKYDELKDKYDTASEELSAYKKKEKESGLFTREKLKKEAARISREDELSRELRKAKAFISACGLSADFQQYKYNSTTRKKTLE